MNDVTWFEYLLVTGISLSVMAVVLGIGLIGYKTCKCIVSSIKR